MVCGTYQIIFVGVNLVEVNRSKEKLKYKYVIYMIIIKNNYYCSEIEEKQISWENLPCVSFIPTIKTFIVCCTLITLL